MKRKEKSGHEKRMRKSGKKLLQLVNGQKSLLTFFEKNSNVNATEKRVQQPLLSEKESNIIAGGDGNDLTVDSQSPQATSMETQTSCWCKGKKLDTNWLVSSEDCLELAKEVKDNR
jgi:hypothetical protein